MEIRYMYFVQTDRLVIIETKERGICIYHVKERYVLRQTWIILIFHTIFNSYIKIQLINGQSPTDFELKTGTKSVPITSPS